MLEGAVRVAELDVALANAHHVILIETHYNNFIEVYASAANETSDLVDAVLFYHDSTSRVLEVADEMHGTVRFSLKLQSHFGTATPFITINLSPI